MFFAIVPVQKPKCQEMSMTNKFRPKKLQYIQ